MKPYKIPYLKPITLACICIATFFLPIKTSISNIGLIGLVITTIISLISQGVNKNNRFSYFLFFSPMVFFIPLLIGFWYSPIKSEAINEISKYIFLGLTPLFLYRKDVDNQLYKKYACLGLLAGTLISAVVLLSINFYNFNQSNASLQTLFNYSFTDFNFTKPFPGMHPVYLGLYYTMVLAILLFGKFSLSKWVRLLCFVLLGLGILFLASRIIYWIAFLMICMYLIHNLPFKVFIVLVTCCLVGLVISLPKLQETDLYKKTVQGTQWEFYNHKSLQKVSQNEVKDTRFTRWQLGWDIAKKHPVLGVGGGVENEVLAEKYKAYNLKDSIKHQYNAHNQFLGFFIRFGIIGFLGLCIYFVKNTISAIRYQHLLFLAFLTILFWTFMVENIMDRNMGINFVALFGTLFYAEFIFVNTKKRNV